MTGTDLRSLFLEVFAEHDRRGSLQSRTLLAEVRKRIRERGVKVQDRAVLAHFNDLYRAGFFGWGLDLQNPDPPFMHLSDVGREALAQASRDPFNPDGYMAHLRECVDLDPVAEAYIKEALKTFGAGCFRAAAVMVGCAAEHIALVLRDAIVQGITDGGGQPSRRFADWKAGAVLGAIESYFKDANRIPDRRLREEFDAHWASFVGQIRLARNAAGHPASVDYVDTSAAHAALLIFPELASLAARLARNVADEQEPTVGPSF